MIRATLRAFPLRTIIRDIRDEPVAALIGMAGALAVYAACEGLAWLGVMQ